MTDSFSFSCGQKPIQLQVAWVFLGRMSTYNVGDDSREQKVLLVFVRALLGECEQIQTAKADAW